QVAEPQLADVEQYEQCTRYVPGLAHVAGSPGRLAAAGLFLWKVHANAFPLQQADRIQTSFGKKQIHHTSAEQSYLRRLVRIYPGLGALRGHTGGIRGGIVEQLTHQSLPPGSAGCGAALPVVSDQFIRGSVTPRT